MDRWQGEPGWVRATVVVLVGLLAYGTVVHVVQLVVAAGDPYSHLPGWLGAYFVSLTVLDPLAAVLLARRRRSGVVLVVLVLVTDALANAVASYAYDDRAGLTTGRVGQAVVTCLAVGALVAAPALWRGARSGSAATPGSQLARGAGGIAVLLLLGALGASFVPTSVDGRACGTWVSPSTADVGLDGSYTPLRGRDTSEAYEETADLSGCPDALGVRRTVTLGLLAGAVVLGAGALSRRRGHRATGAMGGSTPPED